MWMIERSARLACFILAWTLLAPPGVSGADLGACRETTTTQTDRTRCAASHLKAVDDELQRVYQAVLGKYAGDRGFLEQLRNAQRAWLTFRDAELEAKFPSPNKQARYGSVYPMCANLFLAQRTRERITHLREWLDGTEEGDVCAGSVRYKPER